jgi:hypothetical protein
MYAYHTINLLFSFHKLETNQYSICQVVISILNSKFPESSSNIVYNDEDKTELLQRLCRCTTYAVPYCERISVKYTVNMPLSMFVILYHN